MGMEGKREMRVRQKQEDRDKMSVCVCVGGVMEEQEGTERGEREKGKDAGNKGGSTRRRKEVGEEERVEEKKQRD